MPKKNSLIHQKEKNWQKKTDKQTYIKCENFNEICKNLLNTIRKSKKPFYQNFKIIRSVRTDFQRRYYKLTLINSILSTLLLITLYIEKLLHKKKEQN